MADLASLMRIAPTVGAGFAGIDQRQQEQKNLLQQQELAQLISARMQDAQFKAQQQPFELEKLRLGNQKASAELPGISADSRLKGVTADIATATKDSSIDATNTDNRLKAFTKIGTHLGTLAGDLDGLSDLEKPAAFVNSINGLGLPQHVAQQIIQRYSRIPPNMLSKKLLDDSQKILRSTPAHAQAIDQEAMQQKGQTERVRMQTASAERVAEKNAEARRKQIGDAKTIIDTTVQKALQRGARSGHAALIAAAEWARQNNIPELSAQYAAMAEQIRPQAEAEIANVAPKPGEIDVGGLGGLPTTPPRPIAPPGAAPKPGPTSQNAAIVEALKAKGQAYEPDKFDYRIGPNGQVQRKAK